ncbi:PaaI family thioesterase [Acidiferrimicrobium sp. IK]|uniref:PaaI family thioesterase n=1 Tax=Acidiferrimicrobium sp. IK TaxID=2871700 RepID=UPI0021CB1CCC|nr:hypothetical protein [Acidiferrimicrobium sp. IK]
MRPTDATGAAPAQAADTRPLRPTPFIPAWHAAGLERTHSGHGTSGQRMQIPDWLRDRSGAVVPGALGLVTDSVLGGSVMSLVEKGMSMVTSHLHFEVLAPIPIDTTVMLAEGRCRSLAAHFGIAEGSVRTESGQEVARATIGSVLVPGLSGDLIDGAGRGRLGAPDEESSRRRPDRAAGDDRAVVPGGIHHLVAGEPVHDRLGTEVVAARRAGVTIRVRAAPDLANSRATVHGGVGALVGERVLDLALRVALEAREGGAVGMSLVELRAAFVRNIPADGSRIEARGTIMHLGRRLAAGRGEVRTADGRPAVLIDATYLASELLAPAKTRHPG